MSLFMTVLIERIHILAQNYVIFLEKHQRSILKNFQYESWTSVERLGKYLSRKTNSNYFVQISCSNSMVKLRQTLRITKSVKKKIARGLGSIRSKIRSKKLKSATVVHKIFQTNSVFHVK